MFVGLSFASSPARLLHPAASTRSPPAVPLACVPQGALKGPDSESLLKQIQTVLKNSSLRDSDLYNMLTMPLVKGDATRSLTKEVFLEGLKRLGFCGPLGMLSSLFRKLDADRSGSIGFSELHSWLTGRTTRINLARRVHLLWERKDGIKQLNELKWTPTSLRRELVWMLQRAEMAPLDLIRAYDKDNDKSFSLREFLIMMKKIVFTAAYCGDNNDSAVENAREGAAVVTRLKENYRHRAEVACHWLPWITLGHALDRPWSHPLIAGET